MRIVHVNQFYIPGLSYQENILPQEQAKLGPRRLDPDQRSPAAPEEIPGIRGPASTGDNPGRLRTDLEVALDCAHQEPRADISFEI